jgi:hypothetical protein
MKDNDTRRLDHKTMDAMSCPLILVTWRPPLVIVQRQQWRTGDQLVHGYRSPFLSLVPRPPHELCMGIFLKSPLSMPASFCRAKMLDVWPVAVVNRPAIVRRRRPLARPGRGA